MTLPADDFLERFLQHVLPPHFVRIRPFGFLANCHRAERSALIRRHLGAQPSAPTGETSSSDADPREDSRAERAPFIKGRGRAAGPKITASDVRGLKYFEKIAPLVEPLHAVVCERDRAGNRSLHYDDLCKLLSMDH